MITETQNNDRLKTAANVHNQEDEIIAFSRLMLAKPMPPPPVSPQMTPLQWGTRALIFHLFLDFHISLKIFTRKQRNAVVLVVVR